MSRIEFGAFQLTEKTKQNVLGCLESGWLTMGPVVKSFEEKWRKLFQYKHARALSSGTSADTACCMALYEIAGAKPGDEIICPSLSFIATANSIRAAGFIPVFVDVNRETLNIDVSKIEAAITPKTKAIMVVNLMGRPADLDHVQNIATSNGLVVIVDNCEAYGSTYMHQYALHYAQMETSSHFLAHIIFAVEGGMVSTQNEFIDKQIEAIRSHGRMGGGAYFDHQVFGLNFKPTDLNFSVGLEEVESFWDIFASRKRNVTKIRVACAGLEDKAYFVEEDKHRINAPHAFSITLKQPGKIKTLTDALDKADIAWKRNFGSMPTQHRAFSYLGHNIGDFPEAEYVGDNGIHIGVHKLLSPNDVYRICDVVTTVLRKI